MVCLGLFNSHGGKCFILRRGFEICLTGLYTGVNILTKWQIIKEMSAEYSDFFIVGKVLFNCFRKNSEIVQSIENHTSLVYNNWHTNMNIRNHYCWLIKHM